MSNKKIPIIAIIGPTAVGKTEFSLALAEKLNAEIISVDSRQVYRYLDVGTDKVSLEIRRKIIHHLIDIVDPDQIYSAANFAADASDAVNRIIARGRTPLLIGGTPFYYKALSGMLSEGLPRSTEIRQQLKKELKERGLPSLHAELLEIDPSAGAKIHCNDQIRTMRALEIFRITGKNASWWYSQQEKINSPYKMLYIGLIRPRPELYLNIERRVKQQFANGYPEEVKWLLDNGYTPELPALQGLGYRELVQHIRGKCSLEDAANRDIKSTKTFSRRQMTWFRHFEPTTWYDLSELSKADILQRALPLCLKHLEESE